MFGALSYRMTQNQIEYHNIINYSRLLKMLIWIFTQTMKERIKSSYVVLTYTLRYTDK